VPRYIQIIIAPKFEIPEEIDEEIFDIFSDSLAELVELVGESAIVIEEIEIDEV
jgi:hypothetical protein